MKRNKGFTVIELMIVVAIFAIIASLAIPEIIKGQRRAEVRKTLETAIAQSVPKDSAWWIVDSNKQFQGDIEKNILECADILMAHFPQPKGGAAANSADYWKKILDERTVVNGDTVSIRK